MFKELSPDELDAREDDIFLKFMSRKMALEAAGEEPEHDKMFCFWRWQLMRSRRPKLRFWKR